MFILVEALSLRKRCEWLAKRKLPMPLEVEWLSDSNQAAAMVAKSKSPADYR
jgi:hypothetical protein